MESPRCPRQASPGDRRRVDRSTPSTRRNRLRKPAPIASRTRGRVPEQRTEVFTDGACRGNPGPGGWAWAVPGGPFASGAEAHSTNQRMEIKAALEALLALDGPVEVVSDSTYVVNCFRDRWWEKLAASRAGATSQTQTCRQPGPVGAADRPVHRARAEARFRWVKGHGGDPMNDLVDRLAVEASFTQQGRSGDEPPDPSTLGPADASRRHADLTGQRRADRSARARRAQARGLRASTDRARRLGRQPGGRRRATAAGRDLRRQGRAPSRPRRAHRSAARRRAARRRGGDRRRRAVRGRPGPSRPGPALVGGHPEPLPRAARRGRRTSSSSSARCRRVARRRGRRWPAGTRGWPATRTKRCSSGTGKDPTLSRLARSLEDHLGEDVWILEPQSGVTAGDPGRSRHRRHVHRRRRRRRPDRQGAVDPARPRDGRASRHRRARPSPATGRPQALAHGTTVATNALLERRGAPSRPRHERGHGRPHRDRPPGPSVALRHLGRPARRRSSPRESAA